MGEPWQMVNPSGCLKVYSICLSHSIFSGFSNRAW